jgi:hypothetical protein
MRHGLLIFSTALLSSAAFAATPILTKTSSSGSSAAREFMKTQSCALYQNKVTLTNTYGLADGSTTTVTQDIALSLQSNFMNLVNQAKADRITTRPNDTCGFASSNVSLGDGTVVFDSGGCGNPHVYREGGASSALMELITSYCTKTFN